jgi:hypothetical protein
MSHTHENASGSVCNAPVTLMLKSEKVQRIKYRTTIVYRKEVHMRENFVVVRRI